MIKQILSYFGYEKKSSINYADIPVNNNLQCFGLNQQTAFWLWTKSDSVGNAVDKIAKEVALIKPVLKNVKTNELIQDHPVLDLIENPGKRTNSYLLKRELLTSLLLTSECYPVLIGNVNFEPSEIYQNYSCNASPIDGKDGYIDNIRFSSLHDTNTYKRADNNKQKIWTYQRYDKLAETTQIKSISASYGNRGQSVLERIYYQAVQKYYGNIHNTSLLKNGSRPSGLWSPNGTNLSQDNYEAFKKEVRDKFSGPFNSGQNVIAPTDVKYQNLLLNPRDMDFIQLIENSRIEIYSQYDIPLPLVLPKTMTMNNYENSVLAFYDFAVLPSAKYLFYNLGKFMIPRYKNSEDLILTVDEKDLTALKSRMMDRCKKMAEANVYSDNEIRNEAGYEEREGGDAIYKPANYVPVGEDFYTEDNIKR